ncbi:hypothetical protein BGS_1196 [Beggiatoa sp. SS]|nr:hypothetical protein BGS_1196 [Beggiatoa sp. SS]
MVNKIRDIECLYIDESNGLFLGRIPKKRVIINLNQSRLRKINFATKIGPMQNKFCTPIRQKQNLFCFFFRSKFILLLLECKIYFASA